ncbi:MULTISPECIES: cytochrome P450 [unclassified Rhodococcus (in: high G+C Gram-positive bacteria)]|uniref:cytochrome P450 n=1 Tax=unclassified Rhodococcus (in: high G+C Gram-positive bacteria) TaxID=192944 RepID=UPI000E0B2EAA|nr:MULTISPECIES: cytochrome P450 [unclassified Rhodococcus (in: high G+C Gram-positive bacteria)]QKT10054.1 cytochrome P450 [Rhodococcus sp. W8901]RDI17574.1 unspecific monooxygenase [Rhodococcus sp. AG1013]
MRVEENLETAATAVPHPPRRLPLLGDVLGVSLHTPVQDSMRIGRQLGPIFERNALGHRFVFVSGADMVAELSDESRFAKNVAPGIAELRGIGGDGLFTAYNEEPNWGRAHNLLRPAFTQSAMRSYHDIMVQVADELTEHWDGLAGGAPVDVSSDMTKLTLETIGRTGFSYSFDSFRRERPHPFVEAMVRALTHAQRRTFRAVPVLGKALYRRSDRQNAADTAYLADVVDEVIRSRRDTAAAGPEDLLEIMLRAAREDDPNRLDDVNIRHQVVTFLVAGHETTSGALSFALYYLAHNPDVLAKARAEVDAVWGDETPPFEKVAKLRYVRRVLDETLRLWPTAPGYAREAREDTVLGGRYPMRAGDWVLVLIPSLHRDPSWGDDPERFDPDRFAPDNVRGRAPHIYKPFGTGERACIGRQFALHEAVLVLGTILRRYDFSADPDYQLRIQERLTLMPTGFTLSLRRRRD